MNKDLIVIANYSEESLLSLTEICDICDISEDYIQQLIEHDIIHPIKQSNFDIRGLQRIKITQRVQKDLGVNLAGIAVILQLLEELHQLRAKSDILDKYF